MDLPRIIAQLPHAPGVYLYQDKAGKIIYVGKAKEQEKSTVFKVCSSEKRRFFYLKDIYS